MAPELAGCMCAWCVAQCHAALPAGGVSVAVGHRAHAYDRFSVLTECMLKGFALGV